LVQKVDKAWTAFYRFTYRQVNLKDVKISLVLLPEVARPVRVGIPSISLVEDKRDDAFDPHRGIYNTFDFGVADRIFGSQINYVRFLVRNATYHPITKRSLVARSTQFGNIYGFNFAPSDNGQIPLAERFFGGGGTSHRGFPENQAGPRDTTTGFPLGGTTLFFNQTELRFPLIGANIGGVLFHDMGNIYSSLSKFSLRARQHNDADFNYMVHAAGVGIRYRTPIGPVRFDLGYSINPPTYNGLDPNLSLDQLADLNQQNPCLPVPGIPVPCKLRNLGHLRWFFSIGQTF
jgi:outer membrane protein assembly factor BamA